MYNMTINNVSKRYTNHLVLENISIDFEEGKVYGLLGKNGVGKTTLLKIVVKLIPIKRYDEKIKILDSQRKMAALISNPSCYMNLRVKDNLKLYSILYYKNKNGQEQAIESIIKDLKIESMLKKKSCELSLGMLQQLKLALTFISGSNILILDEPFNGLDIEATLTLKEKIRKEKRLGKTIIITSHNTEQLEKICDDFVILHDAKITNVERKDLEKHSLEKIYCNILERGRAYAG